MSPNLDAYDRIRARIEAEGFTPELETRIALFLSASKAVNMPFLSMAEAAPATTPAWQALNSQLFREGEAMTLLARTTRWSYDPLVYLQSNLLLSPLYAEAARTGFRGFPMRDGEAGLEAMALGHALLATVRLSPIIPPDRVAEAFPLALLRIEQENGRLIQTQIRLLKDGYTSVPVSEREEIISGKIAMVEELFEKFLVSLE